jgi:hypothetical protein
MWSWGLSITVITVITVSSLQPPPCSRRETCRTFPRGRKRELLSLLSSVILTMVTCLTRVLAILVPEEDSCHANKQTSRIWEVKFWPRMGRVHRSNWVKTKACDEGATFSVKKRTLPSHTLSPKV